MTTLIFLALRLHPDGTTPTVRHYRPQLPNLDHVWFCTVFLDVKWVTIVPDYMGKVSIQAGDKMAWVSFLDKLGVKKGIVIEQVNQKVPKVCTYSGFQCQLFN